MVYLVEVPVKGKRSVRGFVSLEEARKNYDKQEVAVLYKRQRAMGFRKVREDLIDYKGVSETVAKSYNRKIGAWKS